MAAVAAPPAALPAANIYIILTSVYVRIMWLAICIYLWPKSALGTFNWATSAFIAL